MKQNKSIDGLVTKDAKKSASKSTTVEFKKPTRTKTSKPAPAAKPIKVKKQPTPASTTETHEQTVEDFLTPVRAFSIDGSTTDTTPNTTNENSSSTTNLTPSEESTTDMTTKKSKKSKKSTPVDNAINPESPKPKKTKKPHKARRIIITIVIILVILIAGAATWLVLWGNDIIAKITGGQGTVFDLITFMDEKYEPLKTDTNGRTNILAFGTSGYNMDGDEGDGTHDGAQLTDSIMLISLNQDTGDVAMLSLPRDLKASPTCTATGKINEVYWCNNMYGEDEAAGATALMEEVGDILGVDIQYYAHINWGSLISIVDILGGITVTLDEDIEDYFFTGAVFEAGTEYTINGEEALGLARARHGTMGGDFSRGASQQKILIGIKNKIFEKSLSIPDLLGLTSTLGDNLRTNFNVEELKSFAHLTSSFDFDNMRQLSLYDPDNNIYLMTTGSIDGISYVLPSGGAGYYAAIQEYVDSMLSNDPRSYESPTIIILNATDEAGIAATEREKLETEGYTVTNIDNATGTFTEYYTIYSTTDSKPGTKSLLEEYYGVTIRPATELPEDITHDYDFIIILGPSPVAETSNE